MSLSIGVILKNKDAEAVRLLCREILRCDLVRNGEVRAVDMCSDEALYRLERGGDGDFSDTGLGAWEIICRDGSEIEKAFSKNERLKARVLRETEERRAEMKENVKSWREFLLSVLEKEDKIGVFLHMYEDDEPVDTRDVVLCRRTEITEDYLLKLPMRKLVVFCREESLNE